MEIFAKTLTSPESHTLTVDPFLKVSELKALISDKLHIPQNSQILVFSGKQLNDETLLQDNGLHKHCTVFIIQREVPVIPTPATTAEQKVVTSTPETVTPSGPTYMIKISFEGDVRRFEFQGTSASALMAKIAESYGFKNMQKMTLKYKDNEGDLITISTDIELDFAVKYQLQDNLLRLSLFRKEAKPKPVVQTNATNSTTASSESSSDSSDSDKPLSKMDAKAKLRKMREELKQAKMQRREELKQAKLQMREEKKALKCGLKSGIPVGFNFKNGDAVTFMSFADRTNQKGEMGWYLGVNENGELFPNCANSIESHWIIEEVKGAVCFSSALNRTWHLRILDDGAVNAFGARGKFAQWVPEVHGDKVCLRCVAHVGKKNKFGGVNWYLGVTPEGYLIGQCDNSSPSSKFTVTKVSSTL